MIVEFSYLIAQFHLNKLQIDKPKCQRIIITTYYALYVFNGIMKVQEIIWLKN